MPTFDTTGPVTVNVELAVGDLRMAAGDRADTVVEVRPSDPATRRTSTPPSGPGWSTPTACSASKGTRAASSTASALRAGPSMSGLICPPGPRSKATPGWPRCTPPERWADSVSRPGRGRHDCRGGRPAGVDDRHGDGADRAKHWTGHHQEQQRRHVDRRRHWRCPGESGQRQGYRGPCRGLGEAKTANGDICLGEVGRGVVVAETALGKVDVAVRAGVAAWLDLHTGLGHVQNLLEAGERPGPSETTVEVRARSGFGGITIRRAPLAVNSRPPPEQGSPRATSPGGRCRLHTGACGDGTDQLQAPRRAVVGEDSFAPAQQDGLDHQRELFVTRPWASKTLTRAALPHTRGLSPLRPQRGDVRHCVLHATATWYSRSCRSP